MGEGLQGWREGVAQPLEDRANGDRVQGTVARYFLTAATTCQVQKRKRRCQGCQVHRGKSPLQKAGVQLGQLAPVSELSPRLRNFL